MPDNVTQKLHSAALFILPLASIVLAWELIFRLELIRIMPSPLDVAMIIKTRWSVLLDHLGRSLLRVVIGFSLAIMVGVLVGLSMGMNKYANLMMRPLFSLLLPIPTLAWVPILLIVFGFGDLTIIVAIFLGGFFSVAYNTASGVRSIDKDLVLAAKTMGTSRWGLFSKVLLPGSMVSVLAGFRLAIGYSWRALVGAEMLAATSKGIGHQVFAAWASYSVDVMFAALFVIMLAGFIMEKLLVEPIEKRTVQRWGMLRT